jgi:microcystin-dependent protein
MDPYIGEIRIFAGNFAPSGWFLCQGQTLSISSYQALFAIIGITYGGNGTTNFQLPNLQGRFVIGVGISSAGTIYDLGQHGGVEQVSLSISNLPAHTHVATSPTHTHTVTVPPHTHPFAVPCDATAYGSTPAPAVPSPVGAYLSNTSSIDNNITAVTGSPVPSPSGLYTKAAVAGAMAAGTTGQASGTSGASGATAVAVTVQATGNSIPVETTPLYLSINYIIAYNGIFPTPGEALKETSDLTGTSGEPSASTKVTG